jgi:hypothetical protein
MSTKKGNNIGNKNVKTEVQFEMNKTELFEILESLASIQKVFDEIN